MELYSIRIKVMVYLDIGVLMENTRKKELKELQQTIKTSLHEKKQKKLKELEKLVRQYFSMLKPEVMKGRK